MDLTTPADTLLPAPAPSGPSPPSPAPSSPLNVQWASVIKAHHRRVRDYCVVAGSGGGTTGASPTVSNSSGGAPTTTEGATPTPSNTQPSGGKGGKGKNNTTKNKNGSHAVGGGSGGGGREEGKGLGGGGGEGEDLEATYQRWREQRDASAAELEAYAAAMHHLAVYYWDGNTDAYNTGNEAPPGTTAAAAAGVKRPRCEEEEEGDREQPQHAADVSSTQRSSNTCGFSAASGPYNDRVTIALDLVREYFFGSGVLISPNNTMTATPSTTTTTTTVTSASTITSTPAPTPAVVLPVCLTKHLRQVRKTYFAAHQAQLPAADERAAVVAMLTTPPSHSHSTSSPPSAAPPIASSTTGDEVAPPLVRHVTGAALLDYPTSHDPNQCRDNEEADNTDNTDVSLAVLDVGSCYGPFFGATLPLDAAASQEGEGANAPPTTSSTTTTTNTIADASANVGVVESPPTVAVRALDGAKVRVTLRVVGVDLCPYPDSGVLALDWLEATFFRDDNDNSALSKGAGPLVRLLHGAPSSSAAPPTTEATVASSSGVGDGAAANASTVPQLRLGGFGVVIFSFLLSYLPTREMRLRACFHAARALAEGGLLVILSTRTQGARSGAWIGPWTESIERLGLQCTQKRIQSKVITLTFRKVSTFPCDDDLPQQQQQDQGDDGDNGGACKDNSGNAKDDNALNGPAVEAFYRSALLPVLTEVPAGMALHEASV